MVVTYGTVVLARPPRTGRRKIILPIVRVRRPFDGNMAFILRAARHWKQALTSAHEYRYVSSAHPTDSIIGPPGRDVWNMPPNGQCCSRQKKGLTKRINGALSRQLGRFRRDIIWANAPPPGHNMLLLLGVVTSTGWSVFPTPSTTRVSAVVSSVVASCAGVGITFLVATLSACSGHDTTEAHARHDFFWFSWITTVPPGPFFFSIRAALLLLFSTPLPFVPHVLYIVPLWSIHFGFSHYIHTFRRLEYHRVRGARFFATLDSVDKGVQG
jgi:hypothetical protein